MKDINEIKAKIKILKGNQYKHIKFWREGHKPSYNKIIDYEVKMAWLTNKLNNEVK